MANSDVTWPACPTAARRRAHWCVYQPAPPRVAWWVRQRVFVATDAPQVIRFDGLELRSGDTFTLSQVEE